MIDKHYGRNKIFGKGYCHLWTEQYRRTFFELFVGSSLHGSTSCCFWRIWSSVECICLYGTDSGVADLWYGNGFFRFANKSDEDAQKVYANSLLFVGGLSLLFVVLCMAFLHPLSALLEYPDHPDYIAMMVCVVALDSFQCIPFAYLRYKKRPVKFAAIKLLNILGNILLNLFLLLVCPWLDVYAHETVSWFYNPDYLVGYIFVSNLIMSALQMFFFIPELRGVSYRMDKVLMKRMINYSFPILIFGLVGILNQTVDKMIYPYLFDDRSEGLVQLGIYSATSKVALVMAMFTQAFRYAYEPFVFGKNKDADSKKMYSSAMKYFFIFSLLAFLAVMGYMDILKYMVASDYWEGLSVVAIVMLAEIIKGIYFNLSFWYKLTDETYWGAYFSLIGCAVILGLNIWLVPTYGYVASAWASVAGYGVITLLSYFIGQKKIPCGLSVEADDCLSDFGVGALCFVTRNTYRQPLVTFKLPHLINIGFCSIYYQKRFTFKESSICQPFL